MKKPSDSAGQKRCKRCQQTKLLTEFSVARTNRDGKDGTCRACRREEAKRYYAENRTLRREKHALWYETHAKEHSARITTRRDPVKHAARQARYRKAKQEQARLVREQGLREYLLKIAAEGKPCSSCKQTLPLSQFDKDVRYRSGHKSFCKPCALLHARQRTARRRALIRETSPVTIDYQAILERDGMTCHICLKRIGSRRDLEFDHVIPLAKGGLHIEENVRPAHRSCNRYKAAAIL